ncbi:10078_t:CDS:2, partial [Dentiscutata heterogama]
LLSKVFFRKNVCRHSFDKLLNICSFPLNTQLVSSDSGVIRCEDVIFNNIHFAHLPDLIGTLLYENNIINSSKWTQIKASYGTSAGVFIDSYDTTLNNWETNISFTGKPSKYYIYLPSGLLMDVQEILFNSRYFRCCRYFDTINFVWSNSSVFPQSYTTYIGAGLYGPPQTLLPNAPFNSTFNLPKYNSSSHSPTLNDSSPSNNSLFI